MNGNEKPDSQMWALCVANFENIKANEDFCAIVTLARMVNVLHFVHAPPQGDDGGPTAMLNRYNSFLFACALFAEASRLVQKIGRLFKEHEGFRKLNSVVSSKAARELLSERLFTVRNRFVFHFDVDEVRKQLAELPTSDAIFVSGMGPSKVNMHYQLADLLAVRACIGPSPPEDEIRRIVGMVGDVVVGFLAAADEFIADILIQKGWVTGKKTLLEDP